MRALLISISLLFGLIAYGQVTVTVNAPSSGGQIKEAKCGPEKAEPDKRGTEQSPLFVEVAPTPRTKEEADTAAADRQERIEVDQKTVQISHRLLVATWTLAVIATLQFFVYLYQAKKLRETVDAGAGQSLAMNRHIAEAARQANAMIDLVRVFEQNGQIAKEMLEVNRTRLAAQMRAYIHVDVGSAVAQDRSRNVRFEARPIAVNGGHTPAKKVTSSYRAAILPYPLAPGFPFPAPEGATIPSTLGPHQSSVIAGPVDFIEEAEVDNVKHCIGHALYIWGQVRYRDVLQEDAEADHHTNFCRCYLWNEAGHVLGIMVGNNEAT